MRSHAVLDTRRLMAFHSYGTYELLMDIHASLEDCIGATRDGRVDVAAVAARSLVLKCLSVRALLAEGDIPDGRNPLHDQFAGLPEAVVSEGLALAASVLPAGDGWQPAPLIAYVRRFEQELGFAEPPPSVRTPDGLFPALRLTRELLPLNEVAGLPAALPESWIPSAQ
jgi:hypothetical protein